MKPIEFPEQNIIFAKDQPPFLPLPAYHDDEQVISLWQLTWPERFAIFWRGRLWCRQMNYRQMPNAQVLEVESPFIPCTEDPCRKT